MIPRRPLTSVTPLPRACPRAGRSLYTGWLAGWLVGSWAAGGQSGTEGGPPLLSGLTARCPQLRPSPVPSQLGRRRAKLLGWALVRVGLQRIFVLPLSLMSLAYFPTRKLGRPGRSNVCVCALILGLGTSLEWHDTAPVDRFSTAWFGGLVPHGLGLLGRGSCGGVCVGPQCMRALLCSALLCCYSWDGGKQGAYLPDCLLALVAWPVDQQPHKIARGGWREWDELSACRQAHGLEDRKGRYAPPSSLTREDGGMKILPNSVGLLDLATSSPKPTSLSPKGVSPSPRSAADNHQLHSSELSARPPGPAAPTPRKRKHPPLPRVVVARFQTTTKPRVRPMALARCAERVP